VQRKKVGFENDMRLYKFISSKSSDEIIIEIYGKNEHLVEQNLYYSDRCHPQTDLMLFLIDQINLSFN